MKHSKILLGFLVLFCATALFLGCDNNPGDDDGYDLGDGTIGPVVVGTGEIKYFSLSTGEEVPDAQKGTTNWDIAFSRTRLIFTNSGASATTAGSSGQGGVWHTGKTVLSEVTSVNDKVEFAPYNADVGKYIPGMGGGAVVANLNVMTYVGYTSGTGTSTDPFAAPNKYDQKQYYSSSGMPPAFSSTNHVYIIQHGDGTHHSKIQIDYEYDGDTPADVFTVEYENLD
jgi:hypothetical protein